MRVISGTAKGTRLYGAKGMKIRPMLDRVKQPLFDVLGDRVRDARVLDLFAGIGSLGIEALSRGAASADFIEQHRATSGALTANLERAHLRDGARVIVARLPGGLARVKGEYGLIFADPPFRINRHLLEDLFRKIGERGLLADGGILVYRHSPRSVYDPPKDDWELAERRDYGDSIISFYTHRKAEPGG